GYGDGYPRAAPSGTPVLVNGREVPIVGRVAMDMICVDLGPEAQDKPGDRVVLWGEGLPVERIAQATNVSAYELITRLTS
ncbi:alanine racemase, partial [Klebsiella oxytoca]